MIFAVDRRLCAGSVESILVEKKRKIEVKLELITFFFYVGVLSSLSNRFLMLRTRILLSKANKANRRS